MYVSLCDGFHIVLQVLRIGDHNGTIIVVLCTAGFLPFIEYAGMENSFDALIDQPLHMSMGQLCRITLRFRRDGFHTQFIDFPVSEGRQYRPKSQFPEKGSPEGVIFIHIQHPGQADGSPGRLFQRGIGKDPLPLISYHIGSLLSPAHIACALLTAVSADVLSAAGEFVDGQHTVVAAAAAADRLRGIGQPLHFFQRKHDAFLPVIVVPGYQSRAKSAHQAGNVRTSGVDSGNFLKSPKHSLIMEGTALNHDMLAQILRTGQLDDLVQSIFDDRIGKTGRNIRDGGALLLGLLHIGIHKHGAPGSQIHRRFGKQGFFRKALCRISQAGSKILNEGAAAGGAGFIQQNGVHSAVFQLDALHILAADVQNTVHRRVKERRSRAMGNGLHNALIQRKGGFQQRFAVACGTGTDDFGRLWQLSFQFANGKLAGLNGIALIGAVELEQQLSLLANHHQFCGSRTGIDPQKAVAPVICQRLLFHYSLTVPITKFLIIFPIPEQRLQPGHFKADLYARFQPADQRGQGDALRILRFQRRAHSRKQVGVFRIYGGFLCQLQGADKCRFQLCQEVQGAAQERHTAPDGFAAGKA